ncbi:MAG: PHP domain-containing protein [Ruminococcus sp.]|nr:PHP domain-containing protein [Ruminococcus sp.]
MIDLHMHSTCSDGQDKPEKLMEIAAAAGIKTLSLTDHDTINGLERASKAAKRLGLDFITGIEISSQGGHELHILGYGIDYNNKGLINFYEENRVYRIERRNRFIELLNKKGIPITAEYISLINDGKSTGRPHIARALVSMGYADSIDDAFEKYLQTPEFYSCERPKPNYQTSIEMINNAGGIAVLAHPYTLKLDNDKFKELLKDLISAGLCGIECYYSRHTPEQTAYYRRIADEYDLIFTCGSDYHGPDVKPDILLGRGCRDSLIKANIPENEIIENLNNALHNCSNNKM